MLAVVKTPRTEFKVKGNIPDKVLAFLKKEYGRKMCLKKEESEEELVNVLDTAEYKRFKKNVNPGEYVKVYRENQGFTQIALGEKVGMSRSYICDIEKGRRSISKDMAKKLARLFKISVSRFI